MLKKLTSASLLLLLAAILITPAIVQAESAPVLKRVLASGQLRVGMSGNQPPMNVKSRTGAFIGLEVDLANQMADIMGVKLTMVPKPFPELLGALESGEVDMIMSNMSITPGRAADVIFAGPYVLSGKSILTKSANLAKIQNSAELNKKDIKIVSLANSTSQQFVERSLKNVTSVTTQNYDDAVQMVLDDEADAMVADMTICVISAMKHPDSLTTLKAPLNTEPIGIALSASDPQFASLVTNYLDTFESVGFIEQLRKKWMEDASWINTLP